MDMTDAKLQQISRAESLEDVDRTLSLQPLVTPEEIQAFYRNQLNETRGGDDVVGHLQLGLTRAYQRSTYFKACVMGHPGVGKSTELSRLEQGVKDKFRTIRFSVVSELDPVNFRPLDVLLIMMIEVAQQTANVVEPPPARLQGIWDGSLLQQPRLKQVLVSRTIHYGQKYRSFLLIYGVSLSLQPLVKWK
jgi:hypothetical protein